ncbi:hypothetical protein [Virgibacillus siamensis]
MLSTKDEEWFRELTNEFKAIKKCWTSREYHFRYSQFCCEKGTTQ